MTLAGIARWPARGLLALLGLASGVLVGELLVRAFDPYGASYHRDSHRYLLESIRVVPEAARPDGRLFENAPASTLETRTATFATDGAGLRAPTASESRPVVPRAAAEDVGLRILFLGDSVTLGWGVEHEQTWVERLEQLATAPDGRSIEALNAGHLQYTTVQEADWFLANGLALEPDLVVLVAVVNDLEDNFALFSGLMAAEAERASRSSTLRERFADWTSRYLWSLRGIEAQRAVVKSLGAVDPEAGRPIEERAQYRAGWPRTATALDAIRAACAERAIDLVLFDHTVPRLPGYRSWCEAHGVPWFDFTFTSEERARGIENSAADAHANPLGHRLLAEKASAALGATGHLAPRE